MMQKQLADGRSRRKMSSSQGFRDLKVYQMAFDLAMEIFEESKKFPSEEKFSLTDQIRRSSRSVAANIGEGYRKKQYPKMFISKMADADGEATETQVWMFSKKNCVYFSIFKKGEKRKGKKEMGGLWGGMFPHRGRFGCEDSSPSRLPPPPGPPATPCGGKL